MRPGLCRLFSFVILVSVTVGVATGPVAADLPSPESGQDFLARSAESRADYVAGLSDQLVQLHQAGLVRGFLWYERCLAARGSSALADALADYIEADPSRVPEPAARNFIWAATQVCRYP